MFSTNLLKQTGFKITTPRKEILNTLSREPLSAQEVFEVLKQKGFNPDLVTVYRTLDLFTKLEIVRKIQFEDKIARFELLSDKHHHHLVCIKCGSLDDVIINEEILVRQIKKQSKFKVERHALEFFGFCKGCQ